LSAGFNEGEQERKSGRTICGKILTPFFIRLSNTIMGLVLNEKEKRFVKCIREHPRLCLVQLLALLAAFPLFVCTMNFIAAVTPEQALREHHKPLPPGWTAGVMNHGSYFRWWTIGESPVVFSLSAIGLVAVVLFLWISIGWLWWNMRNRNLKTKLPNGG
jgi:apolipoprotein N-acyltransferase